MSNKTNYRREETRRTENGPRWENPNPGAGCNATHVARARRKWKRLNNRAERRGFKNGFNPDQVDLVEVNKIHVGV